MPSKSAPKRRRCKYPWDEWTDGAQWIIYRGEDYDISTFNMQISLHGRAKVEGLKVSSRSFTERYRDDKNNIAEQEGLIFQYWAEDK